MSSKYFKNFPIVEYKGTRLRNIMLKSKFFNELLLDNTNFYDYFVEEGERPTVTAFNYYGSIDYAWLVFLSNNITDPYFEWCLTNEELERFIAKKYGSVQESKNTVVEYRVLSNGEFIDQIVSPRTKEYYDGISVPESISFQPVYAYDKEFELNESKRTIKLIDKKYAPRISSELEKILKQ